MITFPLPKGHLKVNFNNVFSRYGGVEVSPGDLVKLTSGDEEEQRYVGAVHRLALEEACRLYAEGNACWRKRWWNNETPGIDASKELLDWVIENDDTFDLTPATPIYVIKLSCMRKDVWSTPVELEGGDRMSVEEFQASAASKVILNSDGFGRFITKSGEAWYVDCSHPWLKPDDAEYVLWFNK